MRLFTEENLRNFLAGRLENLRKEVFAEPKDRLLNANEAEYVDYLVSKYEMVPLNFQWEAMEVSDSEEMIAAEQFPNSFYVERGNSYPKQVLKFSVPFIGDKELLRYKPSSFLLWSADVQVINNRIYLTIINWQDDKDQILREVKSLRDNLQRQLENVLNDVSRFNQSLHGNASLIVEMRKAEHLRMANLLESLGVPVKKAGNVPHTFVVPFVKSKPLIKPVSTDEPFQPEFSLDDKVFEEILRICSQTGIEMERLPSIYFEKNEETLRDHFIMVLSPHFQSVGGETFNKAGKTDILIRHNGSNVFVAECKFWRGEKGFTSSIDQILRYLTWRDSKAAIICFIRNQNIGNVLEQIRETTQNHKCFVKYKGNRRDGWFDFDFRLSEENPRSLKLSILAFHFPSKINKVLTD